jgi:hypothetical protein
VTVMTTPRMNIKKTKHISNLNLAAFSMSAPYRSLFQQTRLTHDIPHHFLNHTQR